MRPPGPTDYGQKCGNMCLRHQNKKKKTGFWQKSKPTAMNLTSTAQTSSSSVDRSPGILNATGKPESRMRRNSKLHAASSSQGRLKDAYLGGLVVEVAGKPAATDKSQESWDFPESESLGDHEIELTGKLVASRIQDNSGNSKAGSSKWPHHFVTSSCISHG